MKQIRKLTLIAFSVLFVSMFTAGNLYGNTSQATQGDYEHPQWAPPFYEGVRYYYLPDIETYYDIESQEFVYLYDGQWCFSRECPSVNTGFDLSNCFTIALDINVYQPWMHHHYYVSHYPRYYYQDYYDHSNIPYVRGFNENSRSAIFWKENERNRARHFDNEGMRNDRRFRYSNFDRQQQQNWNRNENVNRQPYTENPNRQQPYGNQNVAPSRNSDNNVVNRQRVFTPPTKVRITLGTNYYGGTIGQPVKVEKQMRRQQDQQQNGQRDQHQDHQDHQNNDNRR
jgi:hypothetical protein